MLVLILWIFIEFSSMNSAPGLLFVGVVLSTDLISSFLVCSDFLFRDWDLVDCTGMFLEIYPFLLGCEIC